MGPLFARAHTFLGGERDTVLVTNALEHSPELSFRPFGALVHPGPTFSKNDAQDGLGRAGESVGGLAAELDALQRFGLFGEFLGGRGPDGTILPRVGLEWKSGEHLGVPWAGTVAWCEGTDLKTKAGRRGAEISAAALHEGYWLDIDSVRRADGEWEALQREYAGPANRARVAAVLGVRGFALEGAHDEEEHARLAEASGALLGEGARVRLALLDERGLAHAAADGAAIVGLEESIATTATHEEGHLCDRTRFLPLGQHLGAALRLLFDSGFSASAVQERLEYRAELVCLCDAPDPRVALSDVLVGVEAEGAALTPHAAGYARLLTDLLAELDQLLASDGRALPAIDRERTLVHQLHRLGASEVRSLARSLAHHRGLDRR